MKSPLKNEKRRLEVLWRYDVLDSPSEAAFDDLAGLAAEICDAPIAAITFVDEKRQWFKAKIGLSPSETSRDISFCAHAILGHDLLIVPDATQDKRFAQNPLVTGEPHIRFYAGAPLLNADGFALGALCVIDTRTRELNATQKNALQILSRHVVALLELRRHSREAEKLKRELSYEEKYRRIFEHAAEGIFVSTPEGKFVDANPALARMLGYDSPQELMASIEDIAQQLYVDPQQRRRLQDEIAAHGSVQEVQVQFRKKDGSKIWMRSNVGGIRDAAGKIIFYDGINQDITAQVEAGEQLRQSEAQYRAFFDGNPQPMWVLADESQQFLEVNDAALRHYGFTRADFLARTINDLFPKEDVPGRESYGGVKVRDYSGSPNRPRTVWRHQKKDGSIIYVESECTPIEFRGVKAQLVMALDVTARVEEEFQNEAFARLAQSLSAANSMEHAARIIVHAADELIGWDACSLDLYSAEMNTIHPLLNLDLVYGHRKEVRPAYGDAQPSPRIAKIIREGGALILRDDATLAANPDLRPFGDTGRLSASILFVPVRNAAKVIGILSIQSYSKHAYTQKSLTVLQTLADQCGGALERIDAEEKLAKERHLLRTLLDHLPDYVFVKDTHSRHLLVNQARAKFRGLDAPADAIGQTLFDFLPAEAAEKYLDEDRWVFRTGQPLFDLEEEVADHEGKKHWLLTAKVPLRNKENQVIGLVGISRDITERKRIESALRETEEVFRLISENVSDLIVVVDSTGRRIYNSPSYQLIFPDLKLLKGTDSFQQIHPEDSENVRRVFEETLRTGIGQRIEYRFLLPDGKIRYIESQGNFVRGQTPQSNKVVVISRDITERKRVENKNAALSKLGQKLSAAFSPPEAARVIGETTRDLFGWDSFTLNLFSQDEKYFRPILNIDTIEGKLCEVPMRQGGEPSPLVQRIMQNGAELILKKPPLTMLSDAHPIGDTTRPSASLMYVPVRSGSTVIGVLSIQSYSLDAYTAQDLVALEAMADHCGGALERIRAEDALRISEARFHSVWENSVDGMRLTDEDGTIIAVNKAFCRLVEMTARELEGQLFIVTYAEVEKPAELLQKYRQRFRHRTVNKFFTRRMTFHSGKIAELEGANSFVDLDADRPLLLSLFRDVTEQKRLETQLRQSQKMESIGQLAGGIAHDFNNLLTVIQGHASLLLATERKGELSESLQQISSAAERSANLTRQLLTFSRRQIMQRRNLDFKDVVDDISKMLRRILGEDILLKVENNSTLPPIHADRGMMEQILLNLSVNSRDAMPRGGELVISTQAVRTDENYARQNPEGYAGEFLCLSVADTGCGISPENLAHIFEPFFTTKEVGKGTGLGLATVYGIVKQHEGWIEVTSEVGAGTRFKIFLPRSLQPSETSPHAHPKKTPRGTETILIVEDETPLRQLVQFILERQGYRVLEAESGVAALKVWEKNKGSIDLLLTDLVMPEGINGNELGTRLQKENPNLKVIFTSGYSADVVGKDFMIREGLNFLQKPYHPDRLAQAVRDCLDGK